MTFSGSEVRVCLLVVLMMVVAATVNAAPAPTPSEVVRAVGPLEWLFGSSVDRLGVTEEEEGRRRGDKPAKTKKDKNTKRITSDDGYPGHGYPVKHPEPAPSSGHATPLPHMNGRPISIGGVPVSPEKPPYQEEYGTSHPQNGVSTVTTSSGWNSYWPSFNFQNSFSTNFGASSTYGSGSTPGGYDDDDDEQSHGYDREPTKSQVIVVTLPEIVRTVGKTIYDWNEAFAKYASSFGDRVYNSLNMNAGTEAVGAGVHAVIPLKDFENPNAPYGPAYYPPSNIPSIPSIPNPFNVPQFPTIRPIDYTFPPFKFPTMPSFSSFPSFPAVPQYPSLPTISTNAETTYNNQGSVSVSSSTGR